MSASENPATSYLDGPRLLADVGGTNARFGLERAPGQIDSIQTLRCADYAEFALAVEAYLAASEHPQVRHAAIAIANPVQGDDIKMTNHDWEFSIEATRRRLNLDTLLVVWGKYDPSFTVAGAWAYKQDVPDAEVHILDAGHFAMDTKVDEVATLALGFLDRHHANATAPGGIGVS